MEDREIERLLSTPFEEMSFVLAKVLLVVLACVCAHRFLWAATHRKDYADSERWHTSMLAHLIAFVASSVVSSCFVPLANGKFLADVYSGGLLTPDSHTLHVIGVDLLTSAEVGLATFIVRYVKTAIFG